MHPLPIIQLFFKRPPETRPLLGQLLEAGLNDAHQDVHDRALLYYRCGLRKSVENTSMDSNMWKGGIRTLQT